jgi:glycosyltransferase involved in cell wall biosynthesis
MKRILFIGNSPLPDENGKCRPAAGLRTYQFLRPLLRKGGTVISSAENAFSSAKKEKFELNVVTIAMPDCYREEPKYKEIRHPDGYTQLRISKNDPDLVKRIQALHDESHPDAIVAVNTYPSYVACSLDSRAPLWADLNGWIMAEAQAQARKMESNDYLGRYFKMEARILKRADKLSAVSGAQGHALLGELAWGGRLNNESFGYEFVHDIANGIEWFEGERDEEEEKADQDAAGGEGSRLRANDILKDVPEDCFILLWLGGYNTWVDEVTLFKGVVAAMEECEKLYFVSTGGEIKGLDNKTFAKFKEMIEGSRFKDRFVFLGWVDTEVIPHIYKRADCGLNVDRKCVETLTGARNRINEMMKFGLPVVTTLGSEISYEVERVGAGIGVRSGKYGELGDAIVSIYKEWSGGRGLGKYGKNGQKYIEEECNYGKLMLPLLKWLENPRPAPDRTVNLNLKKGLGVKGAWKYLRENGFKKAFKKLRRKMGF